MPPLSLRTDAELKQALAQALASTPTPMVAWQLGQLCDTPSCAFFVGYQCALRHLDPSLSPSEWAAFAVSEKGVKSPYEMHSTYHSTHKQLQGEKSYLPWPPSGLDWLYLMLREGEDLVVLRLPKEVIARLELKAPSAAPLMPELPHRAFRFDLTLPHHYLYCRNAQQQVNKPFRYFEDVHVTLALAGWLSRVAQQNLNAQVQALQAAFTAAPRYFTLESMQALEDLLQVLEQAAQALPQPERQDWQRDSQLLKFTAVIRQKIKAQLLK